MRVRPGQSAAAKVTAGAPRGAAGKRSILWKRAHSSRRVLGAGKNEDDVVVVMCSLESKTDAVREVYLKSSIIDIFAAFLLMTDF